MDPQQQLYSVNDVLGVSSDAIRRRIQRGQIPIVHFGPRRIMIEQATLDGLLRGRVGDQLVSIGGR